ncbi:3-methyladenine DNA glycosylase [Arenicella chitinivorans]|uniref:3-methyladenine DNA glycosylase n=1 Tax=Arenicella chitinivorans TaxID=1329800 RepID=A0A918RHE2_9GAMM|nr:DNA-3-methyladenine glycosylase I [Arenicella chitinivorans]GGZ98993.1 3-methyladenine DNA glycosylase [Arenicella chitinivorans]
MQKFSIIYEAAVKRKGGEQELRKLLVPVRSPDYLRQVSDDRYLAQLTRCVFNAGFHWRVISSKWDGFEKAFHGFDLGHLLTKSPEEWEAYLEDTRIIRNWQKIQTVYENALMFEDIAAEHGSFAAFFADWPIDDQVGLMRYLHKHGARLGGKTAQWFIRFSGKDGFVLSDDVVTALIANGVEVNNPVTSQRDLKSVQTAFNNWQKESGLPYTHISKVLSYSVGDNVPVDVLTGYQGSQTLT